MEEDYTAFLNSTERIQSYSNFILWTEIIPEIYTFKECLLSFLLFSISSKLSLA